MLLFVDVAGFVVVDLEFFVLVCVICSFLVLYFCCRVSFFGLFVLLCSS